MTRYGAWVPLLIVALCCGTPAALAHPLNRYFIDHSATLIVHNDRVTLLHYLDYGDATSDPEVPALGYDPATQMVRQASKEAYLRRRVRSMADQLHLLVHGERVPWTVVDASCSIEVMPGRTYPFIRIVSGYVARIAPPPGRYVLCEYRDEVLAHRRGMRDILVRGGHPAVAMLGGSLADAHGLASHIAPSLMRRRQALAALMPGTAVRRTADPFADLGLGASPDLAGLAAAEELYATDWDADFPEDRLVRFAFVVGEPIEEPTAAWHFVRTGQPRLDGSHPSGGRSSAAAAAGESALSRWTRWAEHTFETSAQRSMTDLAPGLLALAFGVSFLFGCLHALSPGHGKTVVAAYLVGARGTVRHAVFLGLVVTLTHTGSVFLLAILAATLGQALPREQVAAWTGIVSGVLILSIGIALLLRRWSDFARATPSGHDHHHPDHDHAHDHAHQGHSHEVPADASTWDLLVLGVQGGLVPCPSALVVMLLGLSAFWNAGAWTSLLVTLAMIILFSIGLAAVLITIGILVVKAAQFMSRFSGTGRVTRFLPVVSAVLIVLLGAFWTLAGLVAAGVVSIHL